MMPRKAVREKQSMSITHGWDLWLSSQFYRSYQSLAMYFTLQNPILAAAKINKQVYFITNYKFFDESFGVSIPMVPLWIICNHFRFLSVCRSMQTDNFIGVIEVNRKLLIEIWSFFFFFSCLLIPKVFGGKPSLRGNIASNLRKIRVIETVVWRLRGGREEGWFNLG